MLRLAVEAGYPSLRQWLQRDGGISALEHRELVDLIAVDLVGGERVDWHFARLYAILGTLLAKASEDDDGFSINEFLLENMILPRPEEEDDDALASRATALMTGFAARLGATVETVEMGRDESDGDPERDREE